VLEPEDAAAEVTEEPALSRDPERPKPSRRTLILLVTPIVVLTIAGTIGNAFIPTLAADHPLLLIMLDARNRQLVLARHVALPAFFTVAIVRRMLSDPLFFLLGRFYGDSAVRWLEKKGGGGSLVTFTERLFHKKWASYPMVFLFPGAVVCALAGATGMGAGAFMFLNLAGTIAAVAALRLFSDAVASPVEAVIQFFDRHKVATTTVTVLLVVLSLVLSRLQGKLEMSSVEELEKELAEDPAPETAAAPPEPGGSD